MSHGHTNGQIISQLSKNEIMFLFYLLVVSGEFYGAQVLTGMISSALSYQMPSWF